MLGSIRSLKQNRLKKHKGMSMLLLGMTFFMFIFIMCGLLYTQAKIDYIVESSEDILTNSALGGLYLTNKDKSIYALTKKIPFDTEGISTRCQRVVELCENGFGGYPEGKVKIKEITLYSVEQGAIKSYTYKNPTKANIGSPLIGTSNKTPHGETVTKTGLYLEAEIPVNVMGNGVRATKSVFVTITD